MASRMAGLSGIWLLAAVAVALLAPATIHATMAQTAGEADMPDYENDPEWVEMQRQIEEDARKLMEDAEATERLLKGEPEQETDIGAAPADATSPKEAAADRPDTDPAQSADARRGTVVAIQTTLQAAGCYAMKVDGLWGPGSRRAVAEFARRQGLELDAQEPTPELAGLLDENHSGGRVCPLSCDARHEARGDACVLKTCAKGQMLDKAGRCVAARPVKQCAGYILAQRPSRSDCNFYLAVSKSLDWGRADREASRRNYDCNCR